MWTRRTSSRGTARRSPHGGFAAWFSFSSSFVVKGSVRRSSSVRTADGLTPAALGLRPQDGVCVAALRSRLRQGRVCKRVVSGRGAGSGRGGEVGAVRPPGGAGGVGPR